MKQCDSSYCKLYNNGIKKYSMIYEKRFIQKNVNITIQIIYSKQKHTQAV